MTVTMMLTPCIARSLGLELVDQPEESTEASMSSEVTFIPLNDRLPPDVLSDIFVSHAKDCFDAQQIGSRFHWILLSHVCHQWRAVALFTPRFWSYLHLLRPAVFAALLERSKSVPLHISITADDKAFEYIEDTLELVRNEWHRVQKFRLAAPAWEVHDFCRMLSMPGARLETLVLIDNESIANGKSGSKLPLLLAKDKDASLFPHLRHLELRLMPFKWTDPIFRCPVTTLRVSGRFSRTPGVRIRPAMGTFEQLISALAHLAPTLTELDLQESIPRILPWVRTDDSNLPTVALPSLRLLRLVGYACDCTRLMNHLALPASTRIRFVCYDTDEPRTGARDILKPLSRHTVDTGTGEPLQSLHLKRHSIRARLTLRAWTTREPGSKADAVLEISFRSFHEVVSLNTVLIEGGALFASVHTIVFDGFGSNSLIGLIAWNIRSGSGQRVVVLPNLKTLELRSVPLGVRTTSTPILTRGAMYVNVTLGWLQARREHGVALHALRIVKCANVSEEVIARLKEGGADVWWDGARLKRYVEDDSGSESESVLG